MHFSKLFTYGPDSKLTLRNRHLRKGIGSIRIRLNIPVQNSQNTFITEKGIREKGFFEGKRVFK